MKTQYSPSEERLIEILRSRKGKRMTTLELVEELYPGKKGRPSFPRNTVATTMNRLARKMKAAKETFKIHRTDRSGPYPTQYWIQ